MAEQRPVAPELVVSDWVNADQPITLAGLRGKVVCIHAFQMLCPGCVMHGIPQTQRIAESIRHPDFVVIGLHTVFEHHASMQPGALRDFAYEFRLKFPIGIDRHEGDEPLPATMRAYRMQGTPTTILVDREGRIAAQAFGALDDVALGYTIGTLVGAR